MKYIVYILSLAIVGISCSSDDDNGPSTLTEQAALETTMQVEIADGVLTPTTVVEGDLQIDNSDIGGIGEVSEVVLEEMLLEIDNYEGGENIELTEGSLMISDADEVEIATFSFVSTPVRIKDYDDNDLKFPLTLSDEAITGSIEESFLEDGEVKLRLEIQTDGTPISFDFITYTTLTLMGPG